MEYTKGSNRTDVRIEAAALWESNVGAPVRSSRATTAKRHKKRATATPKVLPIQPAPKSNDPVAEVIQNWKPGRRLPEIALVWEEIAPIVRAHVSGTGVAGVDPARKYLVALARHTATRKNAGHRIDDAEELLGDDALISTFGSKAPTKQMKSSRALELGQIRRLRARLLPEVYEKSPDLVVGRKGFVEAYSPSEIAQLMAYARQRSNPVALHLHAALLLSLGAGLTGFELSLARASDLVATPWGLFIDTQGLSFGGNRGARQVPILAKYEDELSELANEIGDDLFLGVDGSGKPQEPSSMQAKRRNLPRFKANRARSNWTRSLLENGATFICLREAGVAVANEGYLSKLSKDLTVDFQEYITTVRGGNTPFNQSKHPHLFQYAKGQ